MSAQNDLSADEIILSRLMRLDKHACVMMRPGFPRDGRWYVSLGQVVVASLEGRAFSTLVHGYSGETPQAALLNTWSEVVKESSRPGVFFLRYNCLPTENIPGNGPQVWVRWSQDHQDWVDVTPTEQSLAVREIPAERIRPYDDHAWRERL
jgi:hypothetical protein